jgi:hypothetical protein
MLYITSQLLSISQDIQCITKEVIKLDLFIFLESLKVFRKLESFVKLESFGKVQKF